MNISEAISAVRASLDQDQSVQTYPRPDEYERIPMPPREEDIAYVRSVLGAPVSQAMEARRFKPRKRKSR